MLETIKAMLVERYGERWLNGMNNQNGMAEDLSILEKDIMRISRKFGLVGRGMFLSTETEVVARYEVIVPVNTLFDLDAVFYRWWGHRASENISYVEREIADDEVIYHFITGTPTHGHSGRIILMGREVSKVIKKRWERRLKKLGPPQELLSEESIADKSANN
jgi:enoyl reductase-like protein